MAALRLPRVSDGLVTALLVLSVLVGIGGASFLVFRSPAFWGDVVSELATKAWPQIWAVLSKRMPADQEAEWRKAQRLPDGDKDWKRRRLGLPPKG